MNVRGWFVAVWALVTAGIAAVAAYFGYQAGVTNGLAASASTDGHVLVWPGYYGFGFGFGFLPLLFLILLVLFLFARRPRWGGSRGWYGPGYGHGLPPGFESWHKRAHGETTQTPSGKPQA